MGTTLQSCGAHACAAVIVGAIGSACAHARAHSGGFTWVGGQDLNWATAGNWSPNQVPGIDVSGANVLVPSARGVVVAGVAPMTLGEIQFTTAVRFAGTTVLLQGGESTDLELTNDADVFVLGQLTTFGTTQWTYARIEGGGTLENQGVLSIPATSQPRTLDATLRNLQTVLQAGRINLGNGTTVTNESTWELTSVGPANIQEIAGAPLESFVNAGTLKRTGVGSTEIWVPFTNQNGGAITLTAGEVLFKNANSHHGGTYTLANNASLRFWPDTSIISEIDGDTTLDGTGNVTVNNGGLHVANGVTLANWLTLGSIQGLVLASGSAALDIDGGLHNFGKLTWDSGKLIGDGTVQNHSGGIAILASPGELGMLFKNMPGGEVFHSGNLMLNGGVAQTLAGSTWTIENGSIFAAGVGGVFMHDGVLKKYGSAGNPTLVGVPMQVGEGSIEVLGPGDLTLLAGASFAGSNARLSVSAGQVARFDGGTYVFTGGLGVEGEGQFVLDSPSQVSIAGGTLRLGMVPAVGACTLSGVQVSGNGGIAGGIVNQCTTTMSGCSIGTAAGPGVSVTNQGDLTLSGAATTVRGTLMNTTVVHQNTGMDIQGGLVINEGLWILGSSAYVSGSSTGLLRNTSRSTLLRTMFPAGNSTISSPLDNQGIVRVEGGILAIANCVQVQGSVLAGGTWQVGKNAALEFPGAQVTTIGSGATVVLEGDGPEDLIENAQSVDVNGTLEIMGDTHIIFPSFNEVRGLLRLNGVPQVETDEPLESILGDIDEQTVIGVASNGRATGPRLITPRLINGGRIRPGGPGAAGPFNLTGVLDQQALGVVQIEIGGTVPIETHDQVAVEGDVELAGTLEVSLLGDYAPEVGSTFTVLTATGRITGEFEAIASVRAGAFDVSVASGAVVLTLTAAHVPGDLNGDGIVNGADLGQLLAAWGSDNRAADLNDNGVVDGADLGALLALWSS